MWSLLLLQWKVKPSKMKPLASWRTLQRILTKPMGPCPALLIGWTPLNYLYKIWDWSQQSKSAVTVILSTKHGAKKRWTQHLWTAVFLRFVLHMYYTTTNISKCKTVELGDQLSERSISLPLCSRSQSLDNLKKNSYRSLSKRVIQGERSISWLLPSCSWI